MSDYLANLVARSIDPTPAVRPRLATRFEPASPGTAQPWSPPAGESGLAEETVAVRPPQAAGRARARPPVDEAEAGVPHPVGSAAPPPQRRARREQDAEDASPRPLVATVEVSLATDRSAVAVAPGRGERRPQTPATVAPRHSEEAAEESGLTDHPAAAAAPNRGEPRPQVPANAASRHSGEPMPAEDGSRRGRARRVPALDRAEPQSSTRAALSTSLPRPERPDLPPASAHARPPAAAVVPSVRALSTERRPADDRAPAVPPRQRLTVEENMPVWVRPAAPAAEPVIQVTIGRIEVRATPAAAPAPRPRPAASPAMSLEEYLRRRSRRGEG